MKPICCGDRQDAELLLAASSEGLTIDEVNPVWLKTPAAPFPASIIEGVPIDVARLTSGLAELRARFDVVIVEGVGGWLVPIREDYFVGDLAEEMGLPVVVVALNRLGCLNHTMLTLQSVAAQGASCVGVVLNSPESSANVATRGNAEILRKLTDIPILPGLSRVSTGIPEEWMGIFRSLLHVP